MPFPGVSLRNVAVDTTGARAQARKALADITAAWDKFDSELQGKITAFFGYADNALGKFRYRAAPPPPPPPLPVHFPLLATATHFK